MTSLGFIWTWRQCGSRRTYQQSKNQNLPIMVVEKGQLKFVQLFESKNAMVETTCKQLSQWKQAGHLVQVIPLDNAGENKLL